MKVKIVSVSWMFNNILGPNNFLYYDKTDCKLYKKENDKYIELMRQNIYKKKLIRCLENPESDVNIKKDEKEVLKILKKEIKKSKK